MCPFVEKKEKSVVFSLTYTKKLLTLFFQPPNLMAFLVAFNAKIQASQG